MAIKKFSQNQTLDMTLFKQWIDENKSGTFLENLTITLEQATNPNDAIKFLDNDGTYFILRTTNGATSFQMYQYHTSGGTNIIRTTEAYSQATAYLYGAILCQKGMILRYYARIGSSAYTYVYSIAITVDNNGKLSTIVGANSVFSTDISNFITFSPTATEWGKCTAYPCFGAKSTCLAPLTIEGLTESLMLPYAFVAVKTQLLNLGLEAVQIDGKQYITNGVWYIKDGD